MHSLFNRGVGSRSNDSSRGSSRKEGDRSNDVELTLRSRPTQQFSEFIIIINSCQELIARCRSFKHNDQSEILIRRIETLKNSAQPYTPAGEIGHKNYLPAELARITAEVNAKLEYYSEELKALTNAVTKLADSDK